MPAILLLIAILGAAQVGEGTPCQRKMNFLYIVDGSGSTCNGSAEPCDAWRSNLQFMHKLADSFTVGKYDTRVAMVTYGETAHAIWDLAKYPDKDKTELLLAIDDLEFPGGEFDNLLTAHVVISQVFNPLKLILMGREDVTNVAFVITNDIPNYKAWQTGFVAHAMQDLGVKFFVACIQPGCDAARAVGIASPTKSPNEQTIWYVDGYDSLEGIREPLSQQICLMLEAWKSAKIIGGVI